MSDVNKIAMLEAELMELKSRPTGIGDGDIQRIFNQRDQFRSLLVELENVAGALYPLVLMLCDNETSRPKMKSARLIIDYVRESKILSKVRLALRDSNES